MIRLEGPACKVRACRRIRRRAIIISNARQLNEDLPHALSSSYEGPSNEGHSVPSPKMIPEAPASSVQDRSWELQRPWEAEGAGRVSERWRSFGLGLLLALATLLVYAQACQFGFVLLDDSLYVTNNVHVQTGLTLRNVAWSFTTLRDGAWIPLTWLSLMADSDLYGARPGGFHFTNVVLHTLNTVLLFAFLTRATGQKVPSALVAALFALHPLHVESVVWISERKDVLSTFFGLISLIAYVRYARGRTWVSYLVTFVFFVCSLLAKQTLVTLPCVFLLLDYWPLKRFSWAEPAACLPNGLAVASEVAAGTASARKSAFGRLLLEKVPFLFVSAGFSAITFVAQSGIDAVQNLNMLPLKIRFANVPVAYVAYLEKTFFPHDLAVYYPHPGSQLGWPAVCAAASIVATVSACAIIWSRRHPYLLVGWAWYLGTLVPMIGIVQVGSQQMADRYTYFPLIGVFLGLVWTIRSLVTPFVPAGTLRARWLQAVSLLGLAVVGAIACRQVSYWQDDLTLFTHAVASTADSPLIQDKLGCALIKVGKPREGIEHFELAARLDPRMVEPQYNLGVALAQLGQLDQAVAQYRAALAISDLHVGAHNNLGLIQNQRGQYDAAKLHFRRAIELSPDYAEAHMNLGLACLKSGDYAAAISNSEQALALKPLLLDCHRIIARALVAQGRPEAAIRRLQYAISLSPDDDAARTELQQLLAGNGTRRSD
jgi:protein O-mannosyl-transferase